MPANKVWRLSQRAMSFVATLALTFAGLGIWFIVDLVMILVGSFTDKQGRVVANW